MNDAKPLDEAHGEVDTSAHVVCCESTHERIEFGRGRADTEKEWNFDEDDEEGAREAESPEENHYANMEKMRDAQGKAEEYTYHSGPLTINTEIPRREFFCDRHLCGFSMESTGVTGSVDVECFLTLSFCKPADCLIRDNPMDRCHIGDGFEVLSKSFYVRGGSEALV